MAGESILIVDDTPVNLKLTRILLVNEGYKIMTAASGEEALELLRSYHPAMVLADIQLPGMDGLELTRRIKRNEPRPRVASPPGNRRIEVLRDSSIARASHAICAAGPLAATYHPPDFDSPDSARLFHCAAPSCAVNRSSTGVWL